MFSFQRSTVQFDGWRTQMLATPFYKYIYDKLSKFVLHPHENNLNVGRLIISLQSSFADPLMKAKISFFASISGDFEPMLREFQSPEPRFLFLYTAIISILKVVLSRILKTSRLQQLEKEINVKT